MRNIRRKGSAAPQSSWSPTVNAPRYSLPMLSLRKRPTGTVQVPVTATGVKSVIEASRVFGPTFAHGLD